jgi:hypothetical protein
MPTVTTSNYQALSRLLAIEFRSLAMYLSDAAPWWHRGDEKAVATLGHVVADQRAMATRIAEHIMDVHGRVDQGKFPMSFTGLNDCGLDYLIGQLIERGKKDIVAIEACVGQLNDDPRGRALAEEALGAAKGHLESFEELDKQTA